MSEQVTAPTTDVSAAPEGDVAAPRRPRGGWLLRLLGWVLVSAGAVVLLYVVYLLWFTGFETEQAQQELLEEWELDVGSVEGAPPATLPGEGDVAAGASDLPPPPAGAAIATITFEAADGGPAPVQDEPLLLVDGTTAEDLRSGPGHYVDTAAPGGDGNFAISGHRTTYSAPFYDLDDLVAGDLVHVTDRSGTRWTYEVREQRVVAPTDVWVIGEDPLGDGVPLLTITTCHPRFSDAQRLVVFATLVDGAAT